MKARLIIMARQPVPGKAKTRLVPEYGEERAAVIAEFLLLETVTIARNIWPGELVLSVAPDCHHPAIQELCETHNIDCHDQCAGDLGKRMQHELEQVISQGRYAVVTGTDVPHVLKQALPLAWQAARQDKTVIGPSTDGGYYLLGMNKLHTALFSNMPWGSDEVFARTRAVLVRENPDYAELPLATDIDTAEDLRQVAESHNPLRKYI